MTGSGTVSQGSELTTPNRIYDLRRVHRHKQTVVQVANRHTLPVRMNVVTLCGSLDVRIESSEASRFLGIPGTEPGVRCE